MTRQAGEAPAVSGPRAGAGVVLVNLGSPASPRPPDVRAYLREFLSDRRVVDLPRIVWWPILHGWVLRTRPRASAQRYAQVWTSEGAPLIVHTARQAEGLRTLLEARVAPAPPAVEYAMRYGRPSLAGTLDALRAKGCERLLVVPLYPQYAGSSTGSVCDALERWLTAQRDRPAVRTLRDFHDHPGYIAALAAGVRDHWAQHGQPDVLVISFHGIPRAAVDRGDPYRDQCLRTARLLVEALGLEEARYRIAFQSRFGAAEWLKPYTADTLVDLGRRRTHRVDVVCPGFVSDCLETLEEIAIDGRMRFLEAGGREFHALPCLNERPDWLRALADIVVKNLAGWSAAEDGGPLAPQGAGRA